MQAAAVARAAVARVLPMLCSRRARGLRPRASCTSAERSLFVEAARTCARPHAQRHERSTRAKRPLETDGANTQARCSCCNAVERLRGFWNRSVSRIICASGRAEHVGWRELTMSL